MRLLYYRPPLIRLKSWLLGEKCAACALCSAFVDLGQIPEENPFVIARTGRACNLAPAHPGCDCGYEVRTYDWTCLPDE